MHELVKSPAVDLSNSLAGRLPGLVVIQQSGEPGSDGATISIRGTNTLGNSSPLVVIDGIPDRDGGLGRLNPRDVEYYFCIKRCFSSYLWCEGRKWCYSYYYKKRNNR